MARTTTRTVTALVMLALGFTSPAATTPATVTASTTSNARGDQTAAPSVQHLPQPEPNYHYRYAVASRKTGDVKGAWEKRAGEDVWGAYFLRDPDGRWRTVHYEADGTGFYATVQRKPLYRGGRVQAAHQQSELHGANAALPEAQPEALPLDDAAWKSVLARARHSSREDSHPALQKARLSGGVGSLDGAASVASYSTTRAPRAPGVEYSGTQGTQGYAKQALRPPRGPPSSARAAYRSQPLYGGRPAPSYSSAYTAYASEPFRAQQQTEEGDVDETTTTAPLEESDESQAPAQTIEDADHADAEQFAGPQGPQVSAAYRNTASDDEPQHQEGESEDSNEAVHDEEKYEDEDDDKQRDEEGGGQDGEHNPDDDHEVVPEQALQSSQVRNEHEALRVAPQLRVPQLHVDHLQESQHLQPPLVREPGLAGLAGSSMEQLLGPAWSQVASHSALFEGSDFPLFRQNLRNEETPQDTQNVPTWTHRERVDRAKGRRAVAPGLGQGLGQDLVDTGRGRAKAGFDRGAGRFSGPSAPSRGSAAFGSNDRLPGHAGVVGAPDQAVRSSGAPSTEPSWAFGSKVPSREDASFPSASTPSKRGKNPNRGPVLFAHQQVEASTPAGDRRPPPRGYALPKALPQDDKAAWLQARQPRLVSYSGWLPVTASLQAQQTAESYRGSPPTPRGAPRGRRRTSSKPLGSREAPRASSSLWKQSWF